MRYLLIFVLIMYVISNTLEAGTVETWSGAGPNACNGDCSIEWAFSQLTEKEQLELSDVIDYNLIPSVITVKNGDVFDLMSYSVNGEPISYRTTTIAQLDHIEYATGWVMEDWTFAKLAACQNWVIIRHSNVEPIVMPTPTISVRKPPTYFGQPPTTSVSAPPTTSFSAPPTTRYGTPPVSDPPVGDPPTTFVNVPPTPSPVPLPPTIFLFLIALVMGVLVSFKK